MYYHWAEKLSGFEGLKKFPDYIDSVLKMAKKDDLLILSFGKRTYIRTGI